MVSEFLATADRPHQPIQTLPGRLRARGNIRDHFDIFPAAPNRSLRLFGWLILEAGPHYQCNLGADSLHSCDGSE